MSSPFENLDVGTLHLDVPFALPDRDPRDPIATIWVDLRLFRAADHRLQSTQARRAMETLTARHHATPPVRVATLTPSGRPIALQAGDKASVQVSASHAGGLVAVACRDGQSHPQSREQNLQARAAPPQKQGLHSSRC